MPGGKEQLKKILGEIPFTAEIYWLIKRTDNPAAVRYTLRRLKGVLLQTIKTAEESRKTAPKGKKVFLFASMHYWLEHITMMSIALSAQGHDVRLGYFPYAKWNIQQDKFDIRRQNVYTTSVFRPIENLVNFVNFFNMNCNFVALPKELMQAVTDVTNYDYMYAVQNEEIDPLNEFYKFRYERNMNAARCLYSYLRENRPDVMILPNGTVMELGIAYRVARFLKINTTTYEFNDQRQFMWVAQNDEIMQQNTDKIWQTNESGSLKNSEREQVESLMSSRKKAALYGSYSKKWQKIPAEGKSAIRTKLGLDERPVVLMATNVMGDSLTLGRQVFSKTMTEWITGTIQYFIEKPNVQLIIRIHPGEAWVKHGSIQALIKHTLPHLPGHIHVIDPHAEVNTYDLMDIADLGIVYTTTAGLEMALRGIPVLVAGKTHYRNRGFTLDPNTWVDYFKTLNRVLLNADNMRLSQEEIDLAWKYTYLFFFKYPYPFPWHLASRKKDFVDVSLEYVLSKEGKKKYENTFEILTFQKIQ